MVRSDLLELSAEALMALSNAGFVKRGQKEVAEGKLPQITVGESGEVTGVFADGSQVTLPLGKTLRDARCSCPAGGMCRHRVTLVLAYQALHALPESDNVTDEAWSPADFAAEAERAPAGIISRARRLVQEGVVVQLSKGTDGIPAARFPACDVRFFSRHSLAHARCDCIQDALCEHIVAAVWGFARAEAREPGFRQMTLQIGDDDTAGSQLFDAQAATALDAAVNALLLQLWRDGVGQPESRLAMLFTAARQYAEQLQWRWVEESLTEIAALRDAHDSRSSRYAAQLMLSAVCELPARLAAARFMAQSDRPPLPAAEIVGAGVKGETALEHVKLVSLGARCWSDNERHGVSLVYTDPDSQALMVIERQWPLSETVTGNRRIAGHTVKQLAAGQIVTKAARRRANGALEIAGNRLQTSVLPLSARAWETLGAPLFQPDAAALRQHLQQARPDFVSAKQIISHLHILPVTAVEQGTWDAAQQALCITLRCGAAETPENRVIVRQPFTATAPRAVDIVARALLTEPGGARFIAGPVTLRGESLCMEPLAVIGEAQVWLPDLDECAPFPFDNIGDAPAGNGGSDEITALTAQLGRWLEQGIRHVSVPALNDARALGGELEKCGLAFLAGELDAVCQLCAAQQQETLPTRLAALYQLAAQTER